MRSVLLTLPFLIASSAFAQAQPDSLRMSCAAARGLVQQSGAVVIGTGPILYERFVTSPTYCTITQTTEPAWIQTADEAQCLVGRRCVEKRMRRR